MKVTKNFKLAVMVSMVALAISACGKGTTSSANRNTVYGATCGSTTEANTYTGDIISCQDTGTCNFNDYAVDGKLVLSVIAAGMNGQASVSAALTINGSTYCCTSTGLVPLGYPNAYMMEDVTATISSVYLTCQPSSTGTGYFGGYQTMSIRVGVPMDAFSSAWLTKDQKVVGWVQISSSIQGLGNSTLYVE